MRWREVVARSAAFALLAAAELSAQDAGDPAMTILPELKSQAPLAGWGLAGLFLIASLALAFKNSKRGHLD